ncbi:MAG TPA: hypothetical protein VMI54_07025 [Polyangiaceae bacterium]|nr:hypothetical protein [Polyangiaceae bacterium]
MSRARASAFVLAALLVGAASCGESATPGPAGGAGESDHDGGEAGVTLEHGGDAGAAALGGEAGAGATTGGSTPSDGGSSGRTNGKPAHGGSGGTSSTSSGGSDTSEGGANEGGTTGSGASGGSGALAGGGGLGGSGGASGGSAGGGGASNQLSLCVRLSNATNLDLEVTNDYEKAFIADCNIYWVFYLYYDASKNLNERDKFLNQMLAFNYALWGCAGSPAPTSFDLVYKPVPLSQADADALIDAYMGVATRDLSLSPGESADMRAALERLSEPLLMSPDPGGYSQSRCNGEGGAGGQAGADAGGAGTPAEAGQGGDPGQGGTG